MGDLQLGSITGLQPLTYIASQLETLGTGRTVLWPHNMSKAQAALRCARKPISGLAVQLQAMFGTKVFPNLMAPLQAGGCGGTDSQIDLESSRCVLSLCVLLFCLQVCSCKVE